jgi:ribonuclease HI
MRKSQRNHSSINDTIENWNKISFTNPILNLIWDLLPGFTLWKIWKERNKRIFHSQSSPPDATWTKVRAQVTETVRNKSWTEKDWQCNPEEQIILHNWQLDLTNHLLSRSPTVPLVSPTTWTTPPAHFIKVNFDGASKGNPGPAGYGTVLRNSDGEILGLEAGFIGDTTNNVADLTGLLRGLQAATNKGYQRILLEGDSQPIIKLATRIIHGCDLEKISPSWRLSGLLVHFSHHHHHHLPCQKGSEQSGRPTRKRSGGNRGRTLELGWPELTNPRDPYPVPSSSQKRSSLPGWGDRWCNCARWKRTRPTRKCSRRPVPNQPLNPMTAHRRTLSSSTLARAQGTSYQSTN